MGNIVKKLKNHWLDISISHVFIHLDDHGYQIKPFLRREKSFYSN